LALFDITQNNSSIGPAICGTGSRVYGILIRYDFDEGENMDWVKQLNEAINYIEENLTSEISYEVISKKDICSYFCR